jgi:hypothetical protein
VHSVITPIAVAWNIAMVTPPEEEGKRVAIDSSQKAGRQCQKCAIN